MLLRTVDHVIVTEDSLQIPNTMIYQVNLSQPVTEITISNAVILGSRSNFTIDPTNLVVYNNRDAPAGRYELTIVIDISSSMDSRIIGSLVVDVLPQGKLYPITFIKITIALHVHVHVSQKQAFYLWFFFSIP